MVTETENISPTIKKMRVGDIVEFPIEKLNYIKVLVSNIKAIQGKKFTTKQYTNERIVEVIRKK